MPTSIENYKMLGYLDRGAHGQCFLYERLGDMLRPKVVIKRIPAMPADVSIAEVDVLKKCRHPFIIGFYEMFFYDNMCYIVMQYAEGGSLAGEINRRRKTEPYDYFSMERIINYFTQVTMALDYLHKDRILHRDLKPGNLLLNASRNLIKVADFGISKILDCDEARTVVGTSFYLAPEMYKGFPYNSSVDVWALGCILYELCELELAFPGPCPMINICQRVYKKPVRCTDRYIAKIISDCLTVDSDSRPTTRQILACPPIMLAIGNLVSLIEL